MAKKRGKVTEEETPEGPKAAENKKRGATGTEWGLNVGQTWLRLLEENSKKKLTDGEMAEFLCEEFPNQKTYTVDDIRLHRGLFNRGRIRDQEPFGEVLDEDDKLHEYAVKDGKKIKLPLRKKVVKAKGKKAKTEDVADEPDFDDEDDDEEEEAPKKRKRRRKTA